jgi:hypothetical protein
VIDRFRGATSLFKKSPTRRGQLDVSATYEQLDSKLSLQGLDLLAKRWHGHPEALGGSPEVQLFGNGDEVAQLRNSIRASYPFASFVREDASVEGVRSVRRAKFR